MRDNNIVSRRAFGALAAVVAGFGSRPVLADDSTPNDPWPLLTKEIFGDKSVGDGSKTILLDAPYRALDAAVVPISMRFLQPDAVRGLTLVIDQNPSPLAVQFRFGEGSGISALSTNVRVNDYTNIHAISELNDGTLLGTERFVKAAGGCSAPMVKEEATDIPLGTMRFRQFPPAPGGKTRDAQLIIRHPNNSGMQMDQLSHLYIPAHYITSVRIYQGDVLLLSAETGISIAQNPDFRFSFVPNSAKYFRAEAIDNKNQHFSEQWPAAPAA